MPIQQNTGYRETEGDIERSIFDQAATDISTLYNTIIASPSSSGTLQTLANSVTDNTATLTDVAKSLQQNNDYIVTALKTGQPVTIPSVTDFIKQNQNDPQAVQLAAKQYGLDLPAISNALGMSQTQAQDYFRAAGVPLGTMLTGTVQRTFGTEGGIRQLDKGEDVGTEQVVGTQGDKLVVQQYDAYGIPTNTRLSDPNPSDAQGWLQALGIVGAATGLSGLFDAAAAGAGAGTTAAGAGSSTAVAGVEGAISQAATTAQNTVLANGGSMAAANIAADAAANAVVSGATVQQAVAAGVDAAISSPAITSPAAGTGMLSSAAGTLAPETLAALEAVGQSAIPEIVANTGGLLNAGLAAGAAAGALTPTTTPSLTVTSTPLPASTIPAEVIAGGLGAGTLATLDTVGTQATQDLVNQAANQNINVAPTTPVVPPVVPPATTTTTPSNTLGSLINAGVNYQQAKEAADALLASGQLSQQQYNNLANTLQTGYQGIQGQYNQLGQNIRDTYTQLGDTYATQMDLLGGRYAGLGQQLGSGLMGLGGNLQGQYNQLGGQFSNMAGDVRTTYNQFADEAARNVGKFTPYGVTSNLVGDAGTGVQNAALQASRQSFEQAGLTNVDQLSQDYYKKLSALSAPEIERQRLATEERLRAQGRLGVSGSAYGGSSPELLAQEQAIAQQQLQRELQSRQAALGERGTLLSQGTAALQPAVQLGQFGSQAAQQQFANDLARQQYLTGLQTQGLQNEIALRTQAGNLAAQGIGAYGDLQRQGLLSQAQLEQAGLGVSQQGLTNRANILGQGISSQAGLVGRGIGAAEQGLAGSVALQRQGVQDLLARQLAATAARSGANQQLTQSLFGGTGGGVGGVLGNALGGLFNTNAAGGLNSIGFGTGSGYGNQDIGLFI
jgi:hypothetical protein